MHETDYNYLYDPEKKPSFFCGDDPQRQPLDLGQDLAPTLRKMTEIVLKVKQQEQEQEKKRELSLAEETDEGKPGARTTAEPDDVVSKQEKLLRQVREEVRQAAVRWNAATKPGSDISSLEEFFKRNHYLQGRKVNDEFQYTWPRHGSYVDENHKQKTTAHKLRYLLSVALSHIRVFGEEFGRVYADQVSSGTSKVNELGVPKHSELARIDTIMEKRFAEYDTQFAEYDTQYHKNAAPEKNAAELGMWDRIFGSFCSACEVRRDDWAI